MADEPVGPAPKKLKFTLAFDGALRLEGAGSPCYEGGKETCCIVPADITFLQFQAKLWQVSKAQCKLHELGLRFQVGGGIGQELPQLQPLASQADLDCLKVMHTKLAQHSRPAAPGAAGPAKLLVLVMQPGPGAKQGPGGGPAGEAAAAPRAKPAAAVPLTATAPAGGLLNGRLPAEGAGAATAAAAARPSTAPAPPPRAEPEPPGQVQPPLQPTPAPPPPAAASAFAKSAMRPSASSPPNSRPPSFMNKKASVDLDSLAKRPSGELGALEGGEPGGQRTVRLSPHGVSFGVPPEGPGEERERGDAARPAGRAAAEGPRRPTTFISKPFPLPRRTELRTPARQGSRAGSESGADEMSEPMEVLPAPAGEDEPGAPSPKSGRPPMRRSNFAADTLSEITEALRKAGPQGDPLEGLPPEALEEAVVLQRVASDLEQALNKGLAFKGVFNEVIADEDEALLAISSSERSFSIPSYHPRAKAPQLGPKKRVTIQEPEKAASPTVAPAKLPLRLLVGSGLKAGQWTEDGEWSEDKEEVLPDVPPHLQPIRSEDLVKVKELGRGQFGSVWLCQWLGVEVAVKELHAAGTPQTCREMLGEADTMSSLRHPCVITFYGLVINQDAPATVIEFVRGGSLRSALQKLKAAGPVSPRLRAAIALQAARGMEYLHTRRVVHFDLKCDNLLCDLRDPLRPAVKIGDLGLSKQKATTFVSGNMRGTLPWMAVELFPANGQDEGVTEKVDVFSFGVCMFEIWTCGGAPYVGLSVPAIFAGVMSGRLRPAVPGDCPHSWASLMQACWQGAPTARPGFDEVAKRLEAMVVEFAA